VGQPTTKTSAYGGGAPAYKPAPATATPAAVTNPSVNASACGCGPIAIVIPREVTEEQ
jgi:hypothetical protein